MTLLGHGKPEFILWPPQSLPLSSRGLFLVPSLLSLLRTLVSELRSHLYNPGRSYLEILSLMTSVNMYFQMRPHSHVPGVRPWSHFGGHKSTPNIGHVPCISWGMLAHETASLSGIQSLLNKLKLGFPQSPGPLLHLVHLQEDSGTQMTCQSIRHRAWCHLGERTASWLMT